MILEDKMEIVCCQHEHEIPDRKAETFRIRQHKYEMPGREAETVKTDMYVLLSKKEYINSPTGDSKLYVITLIPLIEVIVKNNILSNYSIIENSANSCNVWAVSAREWDNEILFADRTSVAAFEISCEKLRKKGLGTYIIRQLIQWSQKNYPNYKVGNFRAIALDDKGLDSQGLSDMYKRKFNLESGIAVAALRKCQDNKVEKVELDDRIIDVLSDCYKLAESEKKDGEERKIFNFLLWHYKSWTRSEHFEQIRKWLLAQERYQNYL
ncbi:MAG: hypothetical protein JO235_15995 [Chroococcidiopsidaceae cyanobacterium CP_BM_RX_35]|nr:hypothetical protein [Chroococcidiopsidaceae cyanobacterium CP_BM_RX_35]